MDRTYKTFCESITDTIKSPLKRLKSFSRQEKTFWALKDINFEVNPGEVVGIIGRNGAGKTTLLKILSRITHPTEGEVILRGRVASLLEVGTGFHPELTGRENVYFNGAILGMTKQEIVDKFDEIVKFSGVKDFLDTPLKRYSSGMQVRLAFSVAAHLEPEIMLVDEVLAVGDAEFQKKCLGKMKDVATGGRTVLFVSHNMGAIQRLCQKTLYLDQGIIKEIGKSDNVIKHYLNLQTANITNDLIWDDFNNAPGDNFIRLHAIRVTSEEGILENGYDICKPVCIEIEFWNLMRIPKIACGIHLWNEEGLCLFSSWDINSPDWQERALKQGLIRSVCSIPGNLLAEGRYTVSVAVNSMAAPPVCHVAKDHIISFEIVDRGEGGSVRGELQTPWTGIVRPMLKWDTKFIEEIL
jgi:lipopolysaccharide transport system ATP-binding protein